VRWLPALLVPVLLAGGCGEERIVDADLVRALDAVRKETAKYKDVKQAEADGYRSAKLCAEAPDDSGGMGIHYVKPELNADEKTDPRRPEQLLYEPRPGGGVRLAGVEYVVPDNGQKHPSMRFSPGGRKVRLDGPMDGHGGGQPRHYDLHVWLHQRNPRGVFDIWNPSVRC
jgi:hypothetical protein